MYQLCISLVFTAALYSVLYMYQLRISLCISLQLGCTSGPKAISSVCPQISAETNTNCANNPLAVWMLLMRLNSFRQKSRGLWQEAVIPLICSFGGCSLCGINGELEHDDLNKCQPVAAQGLQGNPQRESDWNGQRTKSHIERRQGKHLDIVS